MHRVRKCATLAAAAATADGVVAGAGADVGAAAGPEGAGGDDARLP